MRILVVGASGRFGSRLLPALIARGHEPVAFVRHPPKLESLLPTELLKAISVVQGDGEDVPAVISALEKYQCRGVICSAGSPSRVARNAPPSRQGYISEAVAMAAEEYARKANIRVRGWWVTAIGFLPDPLAPDKLIRDQLPSMRPEHLRTHAAVEALDPSVVAWSILTPSLLAVTGPVVVYPALKQYQDVVQLCPEAMRTPWWMWGWIYFWSYVPGCGFMGMAPMAVLRRYTHEAVADAVAREFNEEKWVGHKVGY